MLRTILGLGLALGLTLPLAAGEMDNDTSAKKTQPTSALATDVPNTATAASELDNESPTQSWRRYGWGGWGCGYRGGWGWGSGYRCGWGGGWGWGGYYRPYYGGWNVSFGYARPWGGISVAYGW